MLQLIYNNSYHQVIIIIFIYYVVYAPQLYEVFAECVVEGKSLLCISHDAISIHFNSGPQPRPKCWHAPCHL